MPEHHYKNKIGWGLLLASLTCLIQPLALAQSDADILDSVRACQRVVELSSRLSCYDRALPPIVEAVRANGVAAPVEIVESTNPVSPVDPVGPVASSENNDSPATREELEATITNLEQQLELEVEAQIIEVQTPNLRTFRLIAADGRVFSQSNATSVIRWPATPFDIEIENGLFGSTIYIRIPDRRRRIRVLIEE